MPQDQISLRIPFTRRNRILGKAFVVVVVGLLFGVLADRSDQEDLQKARTLTLESYTANFETYKRSLTEDKWGLAADLAILVVASGLFFGLYEATGSALGIMIGQFSDQPGRAEGSGEGPPS